MKHFWINIDKSIERRKFMENQFQKNNIDNQRVSAFTPNDFDNILVQKRPLTCKHPGCNSCEYEFACLTSHIKAIQEGFKSGDDYFVIMEDDIYIPNKIDYDAFVKDIPKDAEIVQMLILYGGTVKTLYNLFARYDVRFIKWQYLLPSAGMYIISRKGAEKIINLFYDDNLKKYDFSKTPYQIVADVLLYESVNSYATTLPYAYPENSLGSEIHPDHLEAHFSAIKDIKEVLLKSSTFPYLLIH